MEASLMAKVGLVGGMGPESTLNYYQQLTSKYEKIHPKSYLPIVIDSLDVYHMLDLEEKGQKILLVHELLTSIQKLQAAGADFAALTANTPHMVFDELQTASPIPLLSIVDSVVEAIRDKKQSVVGLLGTKVTMTNPFYKNKLVKKQIKVIVPNEVQIERIHEIISSELELGIVKQSSRKYLLNVISQLKREAHIQGIILGCTELPLALTASDIDIAVYDTVQLHVNTILKKLDADTN
ncbi:aspartate racemase [Liquorilactobacillus uvarum DSM 19971]|uniref:Aspartate racemase n=2 Tax=Liquorilactobacillus uvarum TaxID=303240 RepID=A0A0R1Q2R6_9LACO|nr:aspartate racemase [Liquorilactobacillus uvarum DSM 19971]